VAKNKCELANSLCFLPLEGGGLRRGWCQKAIKVTYYTPTKIFRSLSVVKFWLPKGGANSLPILKSIFLILALTACNSVSDRAGKADLIATNHGLQKSLVKTDNFTLTSYQKISDPNKPLNIYIEGDGFAWAGNGRVSINPTPRDTLLLDLAAIDPAPNIVYLSRPCQYTPFDLNKTACDAKFWTGSRFSKIVIDSMDQAIDKILASSAGKKINLIGYSGGAAVAVIVAAKRSDVDSLRTIAGNLDSEAINTYHKVSPMKDSLNPIDFAEKISAIPQYHFYGDADKIIPEFIANDFAKKSNQLHNCAKTEIIRGATHYSGWKERWQRLLTENPGCSV
jgi:hypothetical protein